MSAVALARAIQGPAERYEHLAAFERAAMGEHPHAARLAVVIDAIRTEVGRIRAAEPPRPPRHRPSSPGALHRWLVPDARDDGLAWDAAVAVREAWEAERDAVDAWSAQLVDDWRAAAERAWLAAADADRDAALLVLVERELQPADLLDFLREDRLGHWHRRAAIADD